MKLYNDCGPNALAFGPNRWSSSLYALVFGPSALVFVPNSLVFGPIPNALVFGSNSLAFGANALVFGPNAPVFGPKSLVFRPKSLVFGPNALVFGPHRATHRFSGDWFLVHIRHPARFIGYLSLGHIWPPAGSLVTGLWAT